MAHANIKSALAIALALRAVAAGPAAAEPVADFYRGRTVTISVGTSAGGGYDTYARVIARHIGRHIPGEPQIVVRNVPGAGGVVLANTLFNVAPKDGTEFGTFNRTVPLDPLLGNTRAQFDPRKFTWLGSPANEVSTCVAWHTSGIRSYADVSARELVTGGPGTATDSIFYPKLSNALLGTKFKIVTGYPGSAEAVLAMERGETQGFCGWSYSSMEATRPGWLKDGKINVLLQYGMTSHPMFKGAPLAIDLARTEVDRRAVETIVAPQLFARPYAAPPDLPPDRAAALIKAFDDTMHDPALLAEANDRRLEIEPVKGSEIGALLQRAYDTPKDALDKAKAIVN